MGGSVAPWRSEGIELTRRTGRREIAPLIGSGKRPANTTAITHHIDSKLLRY